MKFNYCWNNMVNALKGYVKKDEVSLEKDEVSLDKLVEENKDTSYESAPTPKKSLGISDLPPYESAIRHPKQLMEISCLLYECQEKDIAQIALDKKFTYENRSIKKVNLKFKDGTKNSFYIKKSWEGVIKEALGMALSNILLETYFRFVVDKNTQTIAIDEIKGQTFKEIYQFKASSKTFIKESILKNYGVALEFANALRLGDRGPNNLILREDGKIVNIDFGYLFSWDFNHITEIGDTSPENTNLVKEGQIHGRKIMQENIKRNKFLLEEIIGLAKKEAKYKLCDYNPDNPLQTIDSYLSSPIR